MTKIGVVTVTFRARDAVTRSLEALQRAAAELGAGSELATLVVDNASGDGTADRVRAQAPWAELVALPQNVGFAAGCNIGMGRLLAADVIVLLNPDVEVRADFLARLAELDWPSDVAARGPAVFDAQGKLDQSARGFPGARTALLGRTSLLAQLNPGSRLLRRDLLASTDTGPRVVDWVSGACLIAPAERFRSIGPLDDGYFMYWEDADWCFRAQRRGYAVLYEPSLVVTHRQGSSSRERRIATTISFHRSAFRYWRLNVARSRASVAAAAGALFLRCIFTLASLAVRSALSRLSGDGSRR